MKFSNFTEFLLNVDVVLSAFNDIELSLEVLKDFLFFYEEIGSVLVLVAEEFIFVDELISPDGLHG